MSKLKVYEPYLWQQHKPKIVVGVDEVGRGCLAGEVYAGAVILGECYPDGLTDSKKISEKKREIFSKAIKESCQVSIASASLKEIEEINILGASLLAMKRAVENLGLKDAVVLVDGNKKIPGLNFEQITLVKGDDRAEPIAAASIVAKVARDNEVAQILRKNGYNVFLRNHKVSGIEVDIIVKLENHSFVFVEVKSLSSFDDWHFRLSQSQKRRLLTASQFYSQQIGEPVALFLVLVGPCGQLQWVPVYH